MHILVTNDDGPPSTHSSPYVRSLIHHLQEAGHTVSVCLPDTQRSWIGKAHMIGQTVKPLYYRPAKALHGEASQGTTHHRPAPSGDVEEWVLVDGTPASCVQIGLHHFFQEKGPIDLVVSGPNYGRNTTAVFALSSGTLGAALEAAVCGWKAVALSFAFFSRNHDPVVIDGACRHGVRVIEALWKQWPADRSVDLYSVNVPLVEGVGGNRTVFTKMLQNYWGAGSCFQEVEGSIGDGEEEEERIREGAGGEVVPNAGNGATGQKTQRGGHVHKHFKWAPKFGDVYKSVEEAGPGSDGWEVKEGNTSITPMKANFWHQTTGLPEDLVFPDNTHGDSIPAQIEGLSLTDGEDGKSREPIYAVVAYEDPYVQPLIMESLAKLYPQINILSTKPPVASGSDEPSLASYLPHGDVKILNITSYETIDFTFAADHRDTCLVNSYTIRKALVRKHFLTATVDAWAAKRPKSILRDHVKRSEAFEVDYAEFLDDALVEAFDLKESLEGNEYGGEATEEEGQSNGGGEGGAKPAERREWWILKPSMSDRGQGIRLFSTMTELQDIFDEWEADLPSSDDEDDAAPGDKEAAGAGIMTSHLRHFVAQSYIHPPLLVDNRKFHIRTYVLCVGRLKVYVYKPMLALFASKDYAAPWESGDLETHLTNTCLQSEPSDSSVRLFESLPLDDALKRSVEEQIREVTGDLFESAACSMPIHFQPQGNAFEIYGLDFLVDGEGKAWVLEVNAFPDFKQTGAELRGLVRGMWEESLRLAVGSFFGVEAKGSASGDMVLVRNVELGSQW
ncbi:related to pig tubulin-tyrosine ligase [Cephalotrichum gorgonifer]|uniref:Related to pig tubulin-tyrosine ligase n=1 Tax=Cephalotrichum gorgonifer TaxID=2041049 RepID=A0AAE8N578_9PEZI|nr:related to pig tubulin-tyrosine ligase [Cephalotrichum gorgonifer]